MYTGKVSGKYMKGRACSVFRSALELDLNIYWTWCIFSTRDRLASPRSPLCRAAAVSLSPSPSSLRTLLLERAAEDAVIYIPTGLAWPVDIAAHCLLLKSKYRSATIIARSSLLIVSPQVTSFPRASCFLHEVFIEFVFETFYASFGKAH